MRGANGGAADRVDLAGHERLHGGRVVVEAADLGACGAILVSATSCVLARATPIFSRLMSARALIVVLLRAEQHDVAAEYGLENCTCLARSGVIASEAISRSTLLVSRKGMRFGPVTGTSSP